MRTMSEVRPRLQVRVNVGLSTPRLSWVTLTEDSNRSNVKQLANGQSAPSTSSSELAPARHSPQGDPTASTDPALNDQVPLKRGPKSSMPLISLFSPASIDELAQDDTADTLPSTKKARFSISPGPISAGYSSEALVNDSSSGLISPWSYSQFLLES